MPLGTRADSADSIRIQVVVVDICGLISKFSRTLPLEELLKRSLPSIYRSWQHKGPSAFFDILKKQQARHTRFKCPLANACACPGFFWGSQRDQIMQRNCQQDQRGCMGGGGGAPRAPSNRGKSLESWCVENTVLLRAGKSYKADKLLIAGERPADELPP